MLSYAFLRECPRPFQRACFRLFFLPRRFLRLFNAVGICFRNMVIVSLVVIGVACVVADTVEGKRPPNS